MTRSKFNFKSGNSGTIYSALLNKETNMYEVGWVETRRMKYSKDEEEKRISDGTWSIIDKI